MELKELELLKEKFQSEANAQKEPKYTEIHTIDNDLATKIADIDTQIAEIKRVKKLEADIKKKLSSDLFTSTEYNALSEPDKLIAKQALFDYYAEQVNVYYGLNTLEYLAVPLIKILAKCLDTSALTTDELAFYNRIIAIINTHPMTINDVNTWEFNVVENIVNQTITRRSEYRTKKIDITGSF